MDFNIKKFFRSKYILKKNISQALLQAQQDITKELKIKHGEEVDSIIEQMDTDSKIKVEEMKAQIIRMQNEMIEMKKKCKDAEDIYYKSIKRAKKTEIFLKEISENSEKLFSLIGPIVGAIHGIHDKSEWFMNEIEKEKEKDRKKLGKR